MNSSAKIFRRLFALLFFIVFSHFAFSQNSPLVDSLEHALKISRHDTDKIKTLNALCWECRVAGQTDKAENYGSEALQLSEKNNWKKGEAKALNNLGVLYMDQGHSEKAETYFEKSRGIYASIKNKRGIAYALINIGLIHANKGDYTEAQKLYSEALTISDSIPDSSAIALCYNNIGLVYQNKGDYKEAQNCFTKALAIYTKRNDRQGMARGYNNLGIIHSDRGEYDLAVDNYLRSLGISDSIGDKKSVALAHNNIGVVYFNHRQNKKANEYFQKSLKLYEALGNKAGRAMVLINIGLIFQNERNFNEALDNYRKSLTIYSSLGDKQGMALSFNNIGECYLGSDDSLHPTILLDSAMNYQMNALQINKDLSDNFNMAYTYNAIGKIFQRKGNYKAAVENFLLGSEISSRINARDRMLTAADGLAECYKSLSNYKDALSWREKAIGLRDSLFNDEKQREISNLENKFKYESDLAIQKEKQDKQIAIEKEKQKRQEFIIYAAVFALLLVIGFAISFYRNLQQKKKTNKELESAKQIIEEKNKDITDSILYARRIQQALLASEKLLGNHLPEYFVLFKPKDIVSGDFYWATSLTETSESGVRSDRFYLAVCDSTGHGVPGAFMSLLNLSYLNEAITEKKIILPNEVFNHARKRLIENISQDGLASEVSMQDGMDGILFCFDGSDTVSFAAANNAPVIVRNKNTISLPADKMPVGKSPGEEQSFTPQEIKVEKGDMIFAFTDGFADQFGGPKGKKFKYKELHEMLARNASLPMEEQRSILEKTFLEWKGNLEQVDDVLLIGIRI